MLLALVVAMSGYGLAGRGGLEAALWAIGFCLTPGWLVFLIELLYGLPRDAVYGVLVGSFVRLAVALAGTLAVIYGRPGISRGTLLASLAVMYLSGLLLETIDQMRRFPLRPATGLRSGGKNVAGPDVAE